MPGHFSEERAGPLPYGVDEDDAVMTFVGYLHAFINVEECDGSIPEMSGYRSSVTSRSTTSGK